MKTKQNQTGVRQATPEEMVHNLSEQVTRWQGEAAAAKTEVATLRAQRDELLAACEHIVDVVNKWEAAGHALNDLATVRSIAQSAIARAEGRPQ